MNFTNDTISKNNSRGGFIMGWLVLVVCAVGAVFFLSYSSHYVAATVVGIILGVMAIYASCLLFIMHRGCWQFKTIFGFKPLFENQSDIRSLFQSHVDFKLGERAASFWVWSRLQEQNNSVMLKLPYNMRVVGIPDVNGLNDFISASLQQRKREFWTAHKLAKLYGFTMKNEIQQYLSAPKPTKPKTAEVPE